MWHNSVEVGNKFFKMFPEWRNVTQPELLVIVFYATVRSLCAVKVTEASASRRRDRYDQETTSAATSRDRHRSAHHAQVRGGCGIVGLEQAHWRMPLLVRGLLRWNYREIQFNVRIRGISTTWLPQLLFIVKLNCYLLGPWNWLHSIPTIFNLHFHPEINCNILRHLSVGAILYTKF